MRILKIAGLLVAVLLVTVAVLASFQPDTLRVQRSVTIAAPADKVFPFVDDFKRWTAWSPFEQMDPTMRRAYGSPAAGKGATYAWDGEGKAGAGKMTIVESTPSSKVGIALDFERPMKDHADVAFTFVPQGNATLVTWTMESRHNVISKVMCVFLDPEKMIGDDFARGLAALKTVAER
ncbi:MAG: SRPBCC family protein [Vicinamibacteria bacterium]|jgi:hypothetical protein